METKSRQEKKQDSTLSRHTLEDKSTINELELLKQVLTSSRGPNGNIKMVQNVAGGHLTLSSRSGRLFEAMSFSGPVTKLVVTAIQGHLQHFQDGGNFAALLSLNLIIQSIKSGLNRKLIIEMVEEFLAMSLNYFNSGKCHVKCKVKISDLNHMSLVIKSMLTSKPSCCLYGDDLELISRLVIETFLNCLPSDNISNIYSDCLHILCFDSQPVSASTSHKGLLIEFPELPSNYSHEIGLKKVEFNGKFGIKCIIVTVSMSGDTEALLDVHCEVDIASRVENVVIFRLKDFCRIIAQDGIGILFCQKVVHPELKQYCRDEGVKVVDRLGLQLVNKVLDVTGASPLDSFDRINAENIGWLSSVEHVVMNNKSYLHLNSERPMTTLVLCSTEEESLQELKSLCKSCLIGLRHLLQSPFVLTGGGCWEIHLAAVIRKQVLQKKEKFLNSFGCTYSTLLRICDIFTHSLEMVAMATSDKAVDNMSHSLYHHLWKVPKGSSFGDETHKCCCGLYETKYSDLIFLTDVSEKSEQTNEGDFESERELEENLCVVDLYSCTINALNTAVMTAVTVLSINQYIEDIN